MHKHSLVRRILLLIFLLPVLSLQPSSAEGWPVEPELDSEAAILMDADTGQILYAKNPDEQLYPASITKIMTGMLALQNLSMDEILTMTQEAYDAVPRSSAHIALVPGEEMSASDALSALAVASANDAANLLAVGVSGNLTDFAALMTQTAHNLGAVNTHFTNANGLPDSEHYTTARDMALIAAAALKTEGFTYYFNMKSCSIAPTNKNADGHNLTNKNRYISEMYPMEGLLISKTGWTSAALGTLVTAVKRGDTTLIAVALKTTLLESKYEDTTKLMDYGFSQFSRVTLFADELNSLIALSGYTVDADQSVTILLPVGTSMSSLTAIPTGTTEFSDDGKAWVGLRLTLDDSKAYPLPSCVITMTKNPEDIAEAAVSEETAETESAENMEDSASSPSTAIVLVCIAAGAWSGLMVMRLRRRLRHRRITEEKVRRMRQKMGTPPHRKK